MNFPILLFASKVHTASKNTKKQKYWFPIAGQSRTDNLYIEDEPSVDEMGMNGMSVGQNITNNSTYMNLLTSDFTNQEIADYESDLAKSMFLQNL